jgi:hypothetical protein
VLFGDLVGLNLDRSYCFCAVLEGYWGIVSEFLLELDSVCYGHANHLEMAVLLVKTDKLNLFKHVSIAESAKWQSLLFETRI